MSAMRPLVSLVVVIAVTSCSLLDNKEDFRNRVAEDARLRQQAWNDLAIHDYDFDYVKYCECPARHPSASRCARTR